MPELAAAETERSPPLADLGAAIGVTLWTLIAALLVVGAVGRPLIRALYECGAPSPRWWTPPITHGVAWAALVVGVLGMVAGVRVMKRRRALGFFAVAVNASLLFALYMTTAQAFVVR